MQKSTVLLTFFTVGGLLLLVAGLTIHWIFPAKLENEISKMMVLSEDSQLYDPWVEPPTPVYIEFYFFNLTNPEGVLVRHEKPKLQEIGPYTFREIRIKKDIKFTEDGLYVDFRQSIAYAFEREKSCGPQSDWFYGVNIPMLSVADILDKQLTWTQKLGLNMMLTLNGVRLFNNYTVEDYLWGYSDPFFANAKKWLQKFGKDDAAAQIPDLVGLFVGPKANGTDTGVFRIHTGKGDVSKFNQIISWNGNTSVHVWNSKWANMINGTDASMWHPFISREEELYMFSADICRSGSVVYEKDIVHNGLDLYRFTVNKNMMASAEEYPPNADFCTPPGKCMKGGVLNMSVCQQGAPIVFSQPHFYGADSIYRHGVEGMNPTPEMQTKIDVDPLTGAVMHASKYLQFNAFISPLETFPDSLELNDTVYPIMWVKEEGGINEEGAKIFKSMVYGPIFYVNLACYTLMALGAFCLVMAMTMIACRTFRKVCKKNKQMTVVFNRQVELLDKEKGLSHPNQPFLKKNTDSPLQNVIFKPSTVTGKLVKEPAV